jgi:hypothetical protein
MGYHPNSKEAHMPSAEKVARELGKAKPIDDFYPAGYRGGAAKTAYS